MRLSALSQLILEIGGTKNQCDIGQDSEQDWKRSTYSLIGRRTSIDATRRRSTTRSRTWRKLLAVSSRDL